MDERQGVARTPSRRRRQRTPRHSRRTPALLALASTFVVLFTASTVRADPVAGLKQQAADLEAQEHAALLALYGLDSQLDGARAELAQTRSRIAELRRRQGDARAQLRLARRTLAVSERRLGRTLLALYESPGDDPLAVILGASSFIDVLDGLDNLTRIASSHSVVVQQARAARRRIASVARSLRAQAAETRGLEAAELAKEVELEQARAERSAFIGRVRAEGAQLAERILVVEAEARAAQARAEAVTRERTAAGNIASFTPAPAPAAAAAAAAAPVPDRDLQPAPEPEPLAEPLSPAPIQAPPSGARTMSVTATAYSGGGTTATGIPVGYGVVAVDPTVIPFGTRMTIPGYGEGVAADSGSGVRGAWVDVWVPTEAQAEAWGTQTLTITLH